MHLNIDSFIRCYSKPIGQTSLLSTQQPTLGITPSLAALDDAQALRRKEWKRGEPGKDMPRQYSTVSGHLMPTPPKHEDMRMDSTLAVTPEGSLSDLPAAVGGVEETREELGTHQTSEKKLQDGSPSTNAVTSTEETPDTLLKKAPGRNLSEQGSSQVEPPRRIQRTREVSREDTIASTRQFFASVNEKNQATTTELPVETSAVTSEGNTMNLNIPVISVTPTVTETQNRGPRTFLPNGSPSRPTATARCRPQMWVQHVLEGQINEPSQEGTGSAENSLSEPYLLAEGIPVELGHEWRVLHPFEIPGVRFPTDNTPPNQRRLAENDALVKLIQTTEYLEHTPMWGQRDYQLYPPRYGDPFYRGRGRGRGRGRREWLNKRLFERESNGGFGRGFSHGNRRGFHPQATSERDQRDRQEEEWSIPVSVGRRGGDILVGQESLHRTTPTPAPSEYRFFTEWSSLGSGSPQVRMPLQSVLVRETEPDIKQTVNQTTQPGSEPTQIGVTENALQEDTIVSSPRTR